MKMTFEDLDAWKKSRQLVSAIYSLTRQGALSKDFGLSGQIQRAAVSVMSNIAEGFERQHSAEKLQAYNVSRASCGEVRSLLYVIQDNYSPEPAILSENRKLVADVGALVSGLIASTRRRLAAKRSGAVVLIGSITGLGVLLLG